jgi:hypothetical protein
MGLERFTLGLRTASTRRTDTNPKRKRGFRQRLPRLRFGLVSGVRHAIVKRSSRNSLSRRESR